jgi:hypothetical protein
MMTSFNRLTALCHLRYPSRVARCLREVGRRGFVWVSLCGVLLALSGCSDEEETVTHEQMWKWVERHVPVGTPLEAAVEAMYKGGFTCERLVHTDAKIVDINKKAHVSKGVDFVKCAKDDGAPPIIRHWEISLVHAGAHITEVGVRHYDKYP